MRLSKRMWSDPVSGLAEDPSRDLLNAKYQSQFDAAGHRYKFVHEAYVDAYTVYISACFRAKFEYQDGSSWRTAGERIYKSISDANVDYVETRIATDRTDGPRSGVGNDSQHLTVCAILMPPVGSCITKPKLRASYYSEGTQPHTIGRTYSTAASWSTEFTGFTACN